MNRAAERRRRVQRRSGASMPMGRIRVGVVRQSETEEERLSWRLWSDPGHGLDQGICEKVKVICFFSPAEENALVADRGDGRLG